jgi:hypothetical protein
MKTIPYTDERGPTTAFIEHVLLPVVLAFGMGVVVAQITAEQPAVAELAQARQEALQAQEDAQRAARGLALCRRGVTPKLTAARP